VSQQGARFVGWLREPLVHFLILGAGLFLLFRWLGDPGEDRTERIVVTSGQIERLVQGWGRTWQRPPTTPELEGLIEDYIREEILYREALALGLDRDDTIIRRRLRQKMEFLFQDLAVRTQPTDEELRAFLEENPDTFRIAPRLSFQHVYLNPERRGAAVRQDAERLLAELRSGNGALDVSTLGDPLPLPREFDQSPEAGVAGLFGREFTARLLSLEPGGWRGPVESSYGLHLVHLREKTQPRTPELDEVRDAVTREWLAGQRREASQAFHQRLRERYTVIVERGAQAADSQTGAEDR
jgi:hypothetical protein